MARETVIRGLSDPPLLLYATFDSKHGTLTVHESKADAEAEAARDRAHIRVVAYLES